ncbi:hypothetical protein ACQ4PT_067747 [Festuca glaucescens]
MAQASLQDASDIYESIGMYDKVATCYVKLGDYEAAGMVYMKKCGTSRLEDAGDCYAMTECWFQAAEAYFKAKCYTKCFSMCLKGKLFIVGLQFLQYLKEEEECLVENSKSVELSAIRKVYLESCAQHYFECGDIKNMMLFVKAFSSMDHVRAFLNSRNLVDELLDLEMKVGNILEAAGLEKSEANVLGEADILQIAVKVLKCCTSTTYLFKFPSSDLVLDQIPLSAGHFIFQSVRKLLSNKHMIQEWFQKTSASNNSYIPVLQRLVITLYVVTLNLKVGNCYEVTHFLQMNNVFEDLPLGFSQKILYSLQMSSQTLSNFRMVFADALAAIGNRMVIMTLSKVRPIFRDLNADIISRADWKDIEKVLGRFCPEDYFVSNENAPFWEKFEEFRVNKHSQKDAWIIIQFLKSALSWLERRDPPKNMDPQLLEDVRHICNEFEERSARLGKRACVTANDLYLMWGDGENKLRKIMRYLHSEKASMKKDCTRNAASSIAQQHAGDSCKEADAGGNNVVESAKEEAGVAQASKQKLKSKKNPKKSKRHGKK